MPGLPEAAIALFAKAPREGMVKTRLVGKLTPMEAAAFHRECAFAVWERLAVLPLADAFLYSDLRWPEFEALVGAERFQLQRGADLGVRMALCLQEMLAFGYRKVLIVGSDAPTLRTAQLEEALDALAKTDAVLGPSEDGGFTLIGARRTAPGMFDGVAWSRPDTCAAALRAMRAAGLETGTTLSVGYDVDRPEDLERLEWDPGLPPRLARWFRLRRRGLS